MEGTNDYINAVIIPVSIYDKPMVYGIKLFKDEFFKIVISIKCINTHSLAFLKL